MPKKTPNPIDKHVGSKIREARLLAGLSQTDLSRGLGVTFQQVQKYEKGTNRIAPSKLMLVASATSKKVSWFYPDGADTFATRDNDPVRQLGLSREGLALSTAFNEITDPDTRRDVVRFVELIAKHSVVVVVGRKAA